MNNPIPANLDRKPTAAADHVAGSVPVIDIAALRGAGARAGEVSQQIAAACREWGFFQVVNHGVPERLIDTLWDQARRFFAQPVVDKETILRTRENPWGYYNNELTKNQRDKKEVFDFTMEGVDPIYGGMNRWPEGDGAFRRVMLDYLQACTTLSMTLLESFCTGLGLRSDFLHEDFGAQNTGFIRLNYYPVEDPMAGSQHDYQETADLGVHHHTDAGALTVLLQDDVGGL